VKAYRLRPDSRIGTLAATLACVDTIRTVPAIATHLERGRADLANATMQALPHGRRAGLRGPSGWCVWALDHAAKADRVTRDELLARIAVVVARLPKAA